MQGQSKRPLSPAFSAPQPPQAGGQGGLRKRSGSHSARAGTPAEERAFNSPRQTGSVFGVSCWVSLPVHLSTLPPRLCKPGGSSVFERLKGETSPSSLPVSPRLQRDGTRCCFERPEHVVLMMTNQCSKCQLILNPDSHFHFGENHSFAAHVIIPELTGFLVLLSKGLFSV